MTKAQTLPEVIRAFDPMHPLRGQELLSDWYIERPGNPLAKLKTYLQSLGLHGEPVKLLFTGHVGSPNQDGLERLEQALLARMEAALIEAEARRQIVEASGGLMRTLIRLTQRAAVSALSAAQTRIAGEHALAAINEERADFIAGLSRADYPVLAARHQDKRLSADERVARLLDKNKLLEYDHPVAWCDIHPAGLISAPIYAGIIN
jgi:hypothetical protein